MGEATALADLVVVLDALPHSLSSLVAAGMVIAWLRWGKRSDRVYNGLHILLENIRDDITDIKNNLSKVTDDHHELDKRVARIEGPAKAGE